MSSNKELRKYMEQQALSMLYSNSTFGHIERANEQISNIDRACVSYETKKQLDKIQNLLEQVLLISDKIDEKY